jgi:hypothetical protein
VSAAYYEDGRSHYSYAFFTFDIIFSPIDTAEIENEAACVKLAVAATAEDAEANIAALEDIFRRAEVPLTPTVLREQLSHFVNPFTQSITPCVFRFLG